MKAPSSSSPIDWEYQMAYQRGIEAMNWANPAVSFISMRKGNFSLGGGYNTVYMISEPPTPLAEAITPNNQTPYTQRHRPCFGEFCLWCCRCYFN